MKRAGDVISALFDERLMQKARGYSKLFDSWRDIAEKNGIAAAADHSRIRELERGILWVEVDHPGWKQILQTKEHRLLDNLRCRFPGMDIAGISIILAKNGPMKKADNAAEESGENQEQPRNSQTPDGPLLPDITSSHAGMGYSAIKNEPFKESLKRLEQSISAREYGKKK
jgi:hypothetical protein